jgi:hypothetical protein
VLAFFRYSQPLVLPLLLAYTLVLHGFALLRAFQAGFQPGLMVFGGMVLIVLQALIMNRAVRSFKGLAGTGYLPALMYVLLASALGAGWNAPTLAAGFLLPGFGALFRAYGPEPADRELLQAGFWLGLAGVLEPRYWPFLLLGLGMCANLRPMNVRELVVVFSGALAVLILLFSALFLADQPLDRIWNQYPVKFLDQAALPRWDRWLWAASLPVLLGLLGATQALSRSGKSLIQLRKLNTWTALFGLAGLLAALLGSWPPVAVVFPLAYFLAAFIQQSSRSLLWELLHVGMVVLVLAAPHAST